MSEIGEREDGEMLMFSVCCFLLHEKPRAIALTIPVRKVIHKARGFREQKEHERSMTERLEAPSMHGDKCTYHHPR